MRAISHILIAALYLCSVLQSLSAADLKAPRIVVPPAGGDFLKGTNVTLEVVAEGSPPLSYSWHFWGTNYRAISTDRFLHFTNVLSSYSEIYVMVSNSVGTAVAGPVSLNVYSPPEQFSAPILWLRRPSLGEPQGFSPNPNLHDVQFQWNFNGVPIRDATNSHFGIDRLGPEHVGAYTVRMWNPVGESLSPLAVVGTLLTNTAVNTFATGIYGGDIIADPTGNIIVITSAIREPAIAAKFSPEGEVIWSNSIPQFTSFRTRYVDESIHSDSGGGFHAGGAILTNDVLKPAIIKVGAEGTVMTRQIVSDGGLMRAFLADESGATAAIVSSTGKFVRRIEAGTVRWTRVIPGWKGDAFERCWLQRAPGGRIYFANTTSLFCIDAAGEVIWEKAPGDIVALKVGPDGSAYLVKRSAGQNFVRYDVEGQLIRTQSVQGLGGTFPTGIAPLEVAQDGSAYAIAGWNELVRIREDGSIAWLSSLPVYENAALAVSDELDASAYVCYESRSVGNAVVAKFDRNGVRRWERILPGIMITSAENRVTIAEFIRSPDGRLAVSSSSALLATIKDLETEERKRVSARVVGEFSETNWTLRTELTGTTATATNRWFPAKYNGYYNDPNRYIPFEGPVFTVPLPASPTNYFAEIDLSDAVLATPNFVVNGFVSLSLEGVNGGSFEAVLAPVPNVPFRVQGSGDLETWSEVSYVTNAMDRARISVPVVPGTNVFFRIVSP